jgi:hypothetical protein
VDAGATAFPFRGARWLVNIPATWRDAADDQDEIGWARGTYAAVEPFLAGGSYVNFMGDDEDDPAASAYGPTITRLRQVKAVYDPGNVFRLNQNITPAEASPAPVSPAPVSPAPVSPAPVGPAPVGPASASPASASPAGSLA